MTLVSCGYSGSVPITLTGLRRYPVKSCRGEDLPEAVVEPWGLAGDRRWILVDEQGEQLTAREHNRLLTVRPELVPGGLRIAAPGREDLLVAEPRAAWRDVRIWGDTVRAASAGAGADAWFAGLLGLPAHLMYLDDPTLRPADPQVSQPGDVVSFADAFPVLIASTASLDLLNDWIADARGPEFGPLDIRRFRPNLVVTGADPFAEDSWSRIRIGGTEFRVVGDCSRCVLTTIDPDTISRGHEPIATLARHRRWDGQVWFAVNAIPEVPRPGDAPPPVIRVGDEVEVLAASRVPRVPARPGS